FSPPVGDVSNAALGASASGVRSRGALSPRGVAPGGVVAPGSREGAEGATEARAGGAARDAPLTVLRAFESRWNSPLDAEEGQARFWRLLDGRSGARAHVCRLQRVGRRGGGGGGGGRRAFVEAECLLLRGERRLQRGRHGGRVLVFAHLHHERAHQR